MVMSNSGYQNKMKEDYNVPILQALEEIKEYWSYYSIMEVILTHKIKRDLHAHIWHANMTFLIF